jgi:sjoegren syndrome nuclear autoantigen 1
MSQQGATLQTYNNELVKCAIKNPFFFLCPLAFLSPPHRSLTRRSAGIEDLRKRREELQESIMQEEDTKGRLQRELQDLTERISRVSESLARKVAQRAGYDKTIAETEAAYAKVRIAPIHCSPDFHAL